MLRSSWGMWIVWLALIGTDGSWMGCQPLSGAHGSKVAADVAVPALSALPAYMQLGIREWMRSRLQKIVGLGQTPKVYFDVGVQRVPEMLDATALDTAAVLIGFEPVVEYMLLVPAQVDRLFDHYLHIPAAVSRWAGPDSSVEVQWMATRDAGVAGVLSWTAQLDDRGAPLKEHISSDEDANAADNDQEGMKMRTAVPMVRLDRFVQDLIVPFCGERGFSIEVLKTDTDTGDLDAILSAGQLLGNVVKRIMFEVDVPSSSLIKHQRSGRNTLQRKVSDVSSEKAGFARPWFQDVMAELTKCGYVEEKCFEVQMAHKPLTSDLNDDDDDKNARLADMLYQFNCVVALPASKDPRVDVSTCFGPLREGNWLNILEHYLKDFGGGAPTSAVVEGSTDWQLARTRRNIVSMCCDGGAEGAGVCFQPHLLDESATWQHCCNWHEWYAFDIVKYGCLDPGNFSEAYVGSRELPPCYHTKFDWRLPLV